MTNDELRKHSQMTVDGLIERLKNDRELLDRMFPARLLDMEQSAEYLRIPVGTLRHITNEIPHSTIGKRIVFNERDLAEYVERKKVKTKPRMEVVDNLVRKIV